MNRRTTLTLTSMALLFLAALFATAAPKIGLAQSNPLIGTWKLNLAKSKLAGPPPRSQIATFVADGQNVRNTTETIDAQGQASKVVFTHIYDGKPHPTTGVPGGIFDATTYNRIDTNTLNFVRSKDGKAVQTGSIVVAGDGKAFTVTVEGTGANGQRISGVSVYEKQ
jgi:hypothetical protein